MKTYLNIMCMFWLMEMHAPAQPPLDDINDGFMLPPAADADFSAVLTEVCICKDITEKLNEYFDEGERCALNAERHLKTVKGEADKISLLIDQAEMECTMMPELTLPILVRPEYREAMNSIVKKAKDLIATNCAGITSQKSEKIYKLECYVSWCAESDNKINDYNMQIARDVAWVDLMNENWVQELARSLDSLEGTVKRCKKPIYKKQKYNMLKRIEKSIEYIEFLGDLNPVIKTSACSIYSDAYHGIQRVFLTTIQHMFKFKQRLIRGVTAQDTVMKKANLEKALSAIMESRNTLVNAIENGTIRNVFDDGPDIPDVNSAYNFDEEGSDLFDGYEGLFSRFIRCEDYINFLLQQIPSA